MGNIDNQGDDLGEIAGLSTINLGVGRRVFSFSSGRPHNYALLDDKTVKCWGLNSFGQLGLGHTEDQGDDPNEIEGPALTEIF